MKYQEFFEIAKEKGLTSAQIILSRSKATTIVSFNKSIDKYKIADDQTVIASGIYEGRYGSCTTDHLEKSTFPWLVDQIIKAAKTNGQESKIDFFEGSLDDFWRDIPQHSLGEKVYDWIINYAAEQN